MSPAVNHVYCLRISVLLYEHRSHGEGAMQQPERPPGDQGMLFAG